MNIIQRIINWVKNFFKKAPPPQQPEYVVQSKVEPINPTIRRL